MAAITLNHIVVGTYFAILLLLMVYCTHRYGILFLYFKHKGKQHPAPRMPHPLPPVTVQLPVYNEIYVVKRLINAAINLRYPPELLHIQVLDDSTDETSVIARQLVGEFQAAGHTIDYLHRDNRHGYKAGALQEGLKHARGDLIAVFDADFVPQNNFLLQTVPYFSDPLVGMVQGRWGHINRNYSSLTQVQAIFLDAHFILEHCARYLSGRFFNFNGTAGIWRKKCIVSAGGWQHDTLTEDLDLSYRAQLAGWKFVFLPHIVTPAEIPVDIHAFKSQQHRWSKGGIETALKLLRKIVSSNYSWQVKIESVFHLTCNINYLLVFLLAILAYPALVIRITMGWQHLFIFDCMLFWASTLPVALYYLISQREVKEPWLHKLQYLPLLMALGIGLCINNGRGVLEALLGRKSEFLRTPKYQIEKKSDTWKSKKYRRFNNAVMTLIELGLGFYFLSAISFAAVFAVYDAVPFLLLFAGGFFYISLVSLVQQYQARSRRELDRQSHSPVALLKG
jgi:cellulose synthase/poly-beta-1,6-N-acetylglucosamine synthase-like glycosyltransferase